MINELKEIINHLVIIEKGITRHNKSFVPQKDSIEALYKKVTNVKAEKDY